MYTTLTQLWFQARSLFKQKFSGAIEAARLHSIQAGCVVISQKPLQM